MNYSVIRKILGKLAILLASLMLLPLIVSLIYKEGIRYYLSFLIPCLVLILIGCLLNIKKVTNYKMQVREGTIIVGLAWLLMSLIGAIPFMISKEIPNFFDAFFESASGFTTTGASIVTDVSALSHSILFWRSFSHWIGGMGVLVFILAIIPESKEGSALYLLRAESPGPQVGRLVSKMQVSSRILYIIYIVITVVEFLLLWIGPDKQMDLFNSLIYTFGTAGTGGFAAHPQSLEYFSSYSQYVVSIFMLIFGINFTLFYFILIGKGKEIFKNTEFKVYLGVVFASITIICINIYSMCSGFEETFRLSLFQVASIISTTGYSTTNFDMWPTLSKTILLFLMLFGACAGSTAGGLKMSRIIILVKSAIRKIKVTIHPRKVETVYMDKKPISDETINTVNGYFVIYFIILILCALLISIDNYDITTNFTASLACISNVGPGFNMVGPYGSYSIYSDFSKLILSLEMLAGRLELFPILLLFTPKTWNKNI